METTSSMNLDLPNQLSDNLCMAKFLSESMSSWQKENQERYSPKYIYMHVYIYIYICVNTLWRCPPDLLLHLHSPAQLWNRKVWSKWGRESSCQWPPTVGSSSDAAFPAMRGQMLQLLSNCCFSWLILTIKPPVASSLETRTPTNPTKTTVRTLFQKLLGIPCGSPPSLFQTSTPNPHHPISTPI